MQKVCAFLLFLIVFAPAAFSQNLTWKTFASGSGIFFTIRSDGTLWASGGDYLGDGSVGSRPTPIQVGTDTGWASVACGTFHTVALKKDSTLWAWGDNAYGSLGDGTNTPRTSPVQIGASKWRSVVALLNTTIAIRKDRTLWGWGIGNVGNGPYDPHFSPVQIGAESNWVSLAAGAYHILAIKSDGTLWGWGYNGYGEAGPDGTSPAQIGTDKDWVDIYGGDYVSLGLKINGTLWAWGYNGYGQLGDGTTVNKSSPVQVGTSNQWRMIGGGDGFSMGVQSDGTLWAWGQNNKGQLGDGTTTQHNEPVQIGGHDNPQQISRGGFNFYGALLSADGKTFCFTGENYGQFGNGVERSTAYSYECQNNYCLNYTLPVASFVQVIPVGGVGNRVDFQGSCNLVSSITPSGANPVAGNIADSVWIEPSVPTTASGQPYVQRHYGITPSQNGTTATATITLYYSQADFTAYNTVPNHGPDLPIDAADITNNKANVRIYKRSGTSNNGTGLFDTYSETTAGIVPTSVEWNNSVNAWAVTFDVAGFSGFFLASASFSPLPLTLVDFSAHLQAADGVLNWRTANEQGVATFEVERSMDGRNFAKTNSLAATNASAGNIYTFTDKNIVALGAPVVYYRLKMVDNDGTFRYSRILPVNISRRKALVMLYPNPARETTSLQVASAKKEMLRYSIVDATGRTLASGSINVVEGSNVFTIETSSLSAGTYTLMVKGSETLTQVKFVKK